MASAVFFKKQQRSCGWNGMKEQKVTVVGLGNRWVDSGHFKNFGFEL